MNWKAEVKDREKPAGTAREKILGEMEISVSAKLFLGCAQWLTLVNPVIGEADAGGS